MKMSHQFRAFFYALLSSFVLASCSQDDPEPAPAEQVIGSYTGTTYSEGNNGVSQNYDLTNTSIQTVFSISFEVAKKSDNTVTITMAVAQKDENGQPQNFTQIYENVELKKMSNSSNYEMFYNSVRLGEIGNGTLKLEESYDDVDSNGRAIKIDVVIGAKKKI
jgi:hypothetical protein